MPARKNRQQQQLLITGGVVGLLAVGVLGVVLAVMLSTPPADEAAPPVNIVESERPPRQAAAPVIETGPQLVDDDGRTLWASPTDGAPLTLDGLPAGTQLVLSVRLGELMQNQDGRIVVELVGRYLQPFHAALQKASGLELAGISRLTVGVRPGDRYGQIDVAYVAESPVAMDDAARLPGVTIVSRGGPLQVARAEGGRWFVAAATVMKEMLDAPDGSPPLRREMDQLLEQSDADRHVSLLVAPSFFFAEGKPMWQGDYAALRQPLYDQLPDELRGVLASLHWSDDGFYWEARAASTAELPAARLAMLFEQRLRGWPDDLQLALLDLNPAPHGRRVVAKLPAMARMASQYARRQVAGRHAVVNGYLPPAAGHNLLLAADLMLAQQSAGVTGGPAATAGPTAAAPKTAAERLAQRATVSFDRDTLEMALRYLSDEIDVPIVILGGDLQFDGITKNQSFGLDERDKPGEALLVEILRRANPDKTATGPADLKQKLVFVLKRDAGGRETIYVTTRAAAAKRGDELPSVFKSE